MIGAGGKQYLSSTRSYTHLVTADRAIRRPATQQYRVELSRFQKCRQFKRCSLILSSAKCLGLDTAVFSVQMLCSKQAHDPDSCWINLYLKFLLLKLRRVSLPEASLSCGCIRNRYWGSFCITLIFLSEDQVFTSYHWEGSGLYRQPTRLTGCVEGQDKGTTT